VRRFGALLEKNVQVKLAWTFFLLQSPAGTMSRMRGTATVLCVALVLSTSIAGCRDRAGNRRAAQSAPRDTAVIVARDSARRDTTHRDTTHRDTVESAGEVASDFVAAPVVGERWITDANILSLFGAMNARQIAAADVELSTWHSDTVRAFAAAMAREHAELQHSVDSTTSRIGLSPVAPALSRDWMSAMQAQIDTMRQSRGDALDRAYVRQQVASHQLMGEYIKQLAGAAERPELRAFLETAAGRVASQLERARSLHTVLTAADSAADARRASTRKRTSTTP